MCAGDKYVAAGDKRSKVGMGVAGDPAYGNEQPAQRSQWASSANPRRSPPLTRKKNRSRAKVAKSSRSRRWFPNKKSRS